MSYNFDKVINRKNTDCYEWDTTKDGVIILTDAKGKKTTLIDGIDAKAKNTVAWVVSNCFNNKAYEAINALKNHLSTNAK